jgi:hypothetical protein
MVGGWRAGVRVGCRMSRKLAKLDLMVTRSTDLWLKKITYSTLMAGRGVPERI